VVACPCVRGWHLYAIVRRIGGQQCCSGVRLLEKEWREEVHDILIYILTALS